MPAAPTNVMQLVRFAGPNVEVEIEAARLVNADHNGYYSMVYLVGGSGFRVVVARSPWPEDQAGAESRASVYGAVEQQTEPIADGFMVRGRTNRQPRYVLLMIRRMGDQQVLCDAGGETEADMAELVRLCQALRPSPQ